MEPLGRMISPPPTYQSPREFSHRQYTLSLVLSGKKSTFSATSSDIPITSHHLKFLYNLTLTGMTTSSCFTHLCCMIDGEVHIYT